jgi:HK97 gp10 family phage protein
MADAKLEIDGLDEFQSRIDDFDKFTEERMEEASRDIADFMTDEVSDNAPVDTGELRDSIESVVESVGEAMFEIKIGSEADQASPMEFGTRPFFPPPDELRGWARRKLGDADLAYPVARSISETGIEEQPYLRPAFRNNVERIVDRIEQAVSQSLLDLVRGLL